MPPASVNKLNFSMGPIEAFLMYYPLVAFMPQLKCLVRSLKGGRNPLDLNDYPSRSPRGSRPNYQVAHLATSTMSFLGTLETP